MNARNNFNRLLLLVAAAQFFATVFVSAQPKAYTVRKEDSHIGFSIYKWGVFKEEGRFTDFSGSIVYDRNNPAACSVEFIVQATSIDSRNDRRDRAIRSPEFFHVERFPTLSFKSTQVEAGGSDTLLVSGDLTMRGVTKRIMIPVKVLGTQPVRNLGELVGFESTFTVNREDFGIARGWEIIGKEAAIHLLIGAGSNPENASL